MSGKIPPEIVGGVIAGIVVLLLLVIMYRYLLRICRPNEILIFSGRKHRADDGRMVGYRIVFGGRGMRVPVVETVNRMDVSLISVPIAVAGAYSEGGIPLNVHAIANIKVSTDRRFIGNAIERFLGKDRTEIARVVKETLEGHLRNVVATMTPEELNQDRLKFARHLEQSAGPDLEKLGLELDVLKIQHVADDGNYLESIGRQRIAEILRTAEVAESDATREAEQAEAAARARGEVALTNANAAVQRKQNELRQIKAEVDAEANAEVNRAEAAGQQARAEAELELQKVRGELEQLRLQAEVTIPAEVEAQVRELFAAGAAAPIAADGEAMSQSLAEVAAAWKDSGGRAMDMFVLQHLDVIFGDVAKAAQRLKVREVNLIDGGDGRTLPAYAAAYPATMAALLEQVTKTLGIDIAKVISGTSQNGEELVMHAQQLAVVGLVAVLGSLLVLVIILKRIVYICPPNEVLIFSGGHRKLDENRTIGYRVVQGGRGLRIPLIEIVDRMDLTNMLIELRVQGAYSKGGIPLNVQGVANVKVSSKTEQLANAIERFLGMTKEQIMAVARETLEGNLRGVLSTLTPEEVNQDREKFAGELLHEADHDLARLGLELDTLKIQHVSDDKGYLASIGRRSTAELFKRSRMAEAENHALAAENSAQNLQSQEIAKVDAEIRTVRAEGQRRVAEAQTRKTALIAESKGQVLATLAKATAEVDVQRARLAQVRFQLVADKVKPAEARKAQMVQQARGAASKITEDGKATAAAIRSLGETWAKAGDSARQIFVAQKLQSLVGTMMQTVGEMPIDKLTVIDRDLAANGSNFAVKAAVTAEQLKQMLGIDLAGIAQRALPAVATGVAGAMASPPPLPRTRPPTQPGTGKPPGAGG